MIENQLASVPAGKARRERGQNREHDAVGQDGIGPIDAQARIGANNGQHDHGRNGVVPARDTHANARNGQQFSRADDGGQDAEDKGCARRPGADLEPEIFAGEPVEDINAQRRDHEGNREMHQHGVDRVAGNSNGRTDILLGHVANMGIGMVGAGLLAFFQRHFGFFALPRRFAHRFAPVFKLVALCATAGALAGCTGELSALDPAGPRAANLATLWWVMFWGAAVLFALVMMLFFLAYIRSDVVTRLKPAHWIIGGGLVLPIPVLVLLTGTALVLGEQLLPRGEEPLRIGAHASRWEWTFTYPDGRTSPDDVLHIPAGEPVDFVITAEDVIHAFWIPRLGGKIDAIPGHTNIIRLEADEPGTYWGQCAEYCGEGHDIMFFQVEAHAPADFAALLGGGQ